MGLSMRLSFLNSVLRYRITPLGLSSVAPAPNLCPAELGDALGDNGVWAGFPEPASVWGCPVPLRSPLVITRGAAWLSEAGSGDPGRAGSGERCSPNSESPARTWHVPES